jgi:hypothetical protein
LRSGVENRYAAGYAWTVNDNSLSSAPAGDGIADTMLHLVARITDAIAFPVGDAEFDAVLGDGIAALEGAPSPAEDLARAERSLRALMDQVDRLGLSVPEDLRAESLVALAAAAASTPC